MDEARSRRIGNYGGARVRRRGVRLRFGAGPSSGGTAMLTVTRDYGSKTLVEATDSDPPSSETVIRFLDSQADITTRYGGGFVQSINGLAGSGDSDWFFYVNGIESRLAPRTCR